MWNDLEMEIEICSKCALERVRKNPVAGKVNKEAKILFVMDSISTEEDNRNELLTDKNGEYFMKFLEYAKLNLEKCYFTTLTKCSSRGEIIEKNSISKCRDFLTGQIALLKPSYIVTVGENPTRSFIKEKEDIKEMVGNSYRYIGDMWIVPVFDIPYLFKATDKEKWKLIKILTKLEKSVKL